MEVDIEYSCVSLMIDGVFWLIYLHNFITGPSGYAEKILKLTQSKILVPHKQTTRTLDVSFYKTVYEVTPSQNQTKIDLAYHKKDKESYYKKEVTAWQNRCFVLVFLN
tara:strand:- start:70 stop:393 length:324 start_codon:yes stop_codon:yes gene_type:complete